MTDRDMTAPVTRGELHEALETWGGALEARINARNEPRFAAIDRRFEAIDARFAAMQERMDARFDELRALIMTTATMLIDRMNAMWDPVRDLPGRVAKIEDAQLPERVTKLEARVFAKRRASKTTRRRAK